MFTPFVRLLILAICSGFSVYAAVYNIRTLLVFSALVSVIILIGYFRSATTQLTLKAVLKEDWEKADRLIAQIRYPNRLSKNNQKLYMFCQGMIAHGKEDFSAAL